MLSGTSLVRAPMTMLKEQPDRPKPIITPAVRVKVSGVEDQDISIRPMP